MGGGGVWIWGKLATMFLRLHIARELKPAAEQMHTPREEALEAARAKLRVHFDAAWPV